VRAFKLHDYQTITQTMVGKAGEIPKEEGCRITGQIEPSSRYGEVEQLSGQHQEDLNARTLTS